MSARGISASIAIFFLACGPAHGADVAQLGCPLDGLSAEQRSAIGAAVAEIRLQEDSVTPLFNRAVDRCAVDFGWSDDEREAARRFALATAGEAAMRGRFAREGVDVAAIERAILADERLGAALRSPAFSESDVQEFGRRQFSLIQRAAGRRGDDLELMRRLGRFVAARAIMEAARFRFAGN